MSKLLLILAALLLPVSGWAADLDKSNSLTVDKDSTTSSWTATCDISVSGVDQKQIYSGRMLFQFQPSNRATIIVFDVLFQVDTQNRTWTASTPGIYKVRAKLRGHDVIVQAEVTFNSINSGDRIFCDSRIDPGVQPPLFGTTLFGANMVSTVATP